MKLHVFPWGLFNRRVTIYLAEKGITDLERVETFPYLEPAWPPAFLRALSPAGTLPVLEARDGTVIRESLSIIRYLEEIHPSPNMTGRTAAARALVNDLVSVIVEATTILGFWVYKGSPLFAEREAPSMDVVNMAASRYASKLRLIESLMKGPFLAGQQVTIADCLAMATLHFASDFYGVAILQECRKLSAWYAAFVERDSIARHTYPEELHRLAYGLPGQTGQSDFLLRSPGPALTASE